MSEEIGIIEASAGSSDFEDIAAMAQALHAALLEAGFDWNDPTTMAKAMSAAATFAGTLFGQMIVIGLAREQDKRRAGETVLTCFRAGTGIGKRQAYRLAAAMGEGGVAQ